MPAYLTDADPNRALLDRLVVSDLNGLRTWISTVASAAWPITGAPSPPSIGFKARPKDAT